MIIFILIALCGAWCVYNYLTFMFGLPYIKLAGDSLIFRALNVIVLKWSLILGIAFILFGVVGAIFCKHEDDNVSKMKYFILVMAVFVSVCLMF